LALVVFPARTIVPVARMLDPAKTPALVLIVTNRKFVVSKIRTTDPPVLNPWLRIFSEPITVLSTW
jgi:hypothetical protein